MASPDPYMAELQMMSYTPRTRDCKQQYCVPSRSDFIEVLWCLEEEPGASQKWCRAEVLHISGPPVQDVIAQGEILYLPTEYWDQQVSTVEFLNDYLLRCTAQTDVQDDLEGSDSAENPNPKWSWRYCGNQGEDEDSHSTDEEWILNTSSKDHERRSTPSLPRSNVIMHDRTDINMNTLREGHASLAVEVEKVKRELARHSRRIEQIHYTPITASECDSVACMLSRLRHRLAIRLQTGLKYNPKTAAALSEQTVRSRGDGVVEGIMRARVECTLKEFESLARHIHAKHPSSFSIGFSPAFSYTKLPSPLSTEFKVFYSSFAVLFDDVGITSLSDRMEMARKCGESPQGKLLRQLGTYCIQEENPQGRACIYMGTSCASAEPEKPHKIDEAVQGSPVLVRTNREWDFLDNRYEHGLQLKRFPLPQLEVLPGIKDNKAFALHWKKGQELGLKTWSKSLRNISELFGSLEVSLPFILTRGRYLCTEVGGRASDDIWEELLGRKG